MTRAPIPTPQSILLHHNGIRAADYAKWGTCSSYPRLDIHSLLLSLWYNASFCTLLEQGKVLLSVLHFSDQKSICSLSTDVLLFSISTTLTAIVAVIQQCYNIANWRNLRIAQYEASVAAYKNPDLALGPLSTGFSAGLFWTQLYLYNVDGLLIMFW